MSKASKDYHSSVVWDGGTLVLSREVAEEYPEQSCSFILFYFLHLQNNAGWHGSHQFTFPLPHLGLSLTKSAASPASDFEPVKMSKVKIQSLHTKEAKGKPF